MTQIKSSRLYQETRRAYWAFLRHKDKKASDLNRRVQSVAAPLYLLKLIAGVARIQRSSMQELRDPAVIEKIIARVGLTYDPRMLYGDDNKHMNFGPGLWQIPRQLAQALCLLADLNIKTMLELGTYNGWTTSIIAAYLRRFEPQFRMTTVDKYPFFKYYDAMRKRVPVEYLPYKTVEDVQDMEVDLCFIDANHDYTFCKKDYELVGRRTRICMFHDINDRYVGFDNVPRLWQEIRTNERRCAEFHEFTYHSDNETIMGIGIRVQFR